MECGLCGVRSEDWGGVRTVISEDCEDWGGVRTERTVRSEDCEK